jgi:uncharacterized protein
MRAGPGSGRLARVDWTAIARQLDERGHAVTPPLLTAAECRAVGALWNDAGRFRSHIDMARHRFGVGEYRYFAEPLPAVIARLRTWAYARLAPTANRWAAALGREERFPESLAAFTTYCAARGQHRPTPLLLRYAAGGYNCLHQDLYGALAFPLQATFLLDAPGRNFAGGEFVLTEQRPRMQSRAEVVPLGQGDGVVFAVNRRPVRGARGVYRVTMRHGVSRVRAGCRHTLGLIFHDAA